MSAVQIDKSDRKSIANLPFIREIIQTLQLAYSQSLRRAVTFIIRSICFLPVKNPYTCNSPTWASRSNPVFLIRPSPITGRPVDCENTFCKKLQILKSSFF